MLKYFQEKLLYQILKMTVVFVGGFWKKNTPKCTEKNNKANKEIVEKFLENDET